MRGANPFRGRKQRDIREHNSVTILKLIRDHGPLSRSDVVTRTRLSKATVSILIREFEAMGVVVAAGAGEAQTGPKPRLLRFKRDFRYVVGIDLSDVRFEAGLVDLKGELYGEPIYGSTVGTTDLLGTVCPEIDQLLALAKRRGLQVGGIGVAISGLVDSERGIVHKSTVFDVVNLPLQAELELRYRLPVRIDGDVNVRLVAEQDRDQADWSGRNVVYCYIGTGVGAGLFLNGDIYRGTSGLVGEIGHIPVMADGRLCACGRRGCLETVASWPALLRRAQELGFRGTSPEDVAKGAQEGDVCARQACQEMADHLSMGLAALVNLLNPDLILVGGEIAAYPGVFYPLLRKSLHQRSLEPAASQAELRLAGMHAHTGVSGTAGLLLPVILEGLTPYSNSLG